MDTEQTTQVGLEKFVCALYGKPQMESVKNLGYTSFKSHPVPKKQDKPIDGIKEMNRSNLPPCQSVLINKALQCNYIAFVWKDAHLTNPCTASAEHHGWVLKRNKHNINRFDCDKIPQSIISVLQMGSSEQDIKDED